MIILDLSWEWFGEITHETHHFTNEEAAYDALFQYSIYSLEYFTIRNDTGRVIAKYRRS